MTIRVNRTAEGYIAANGNFGINLSVEGAHAYDDLIYTGNHAIYIEKGNIMGFRKRTRRLSSNTTLSKYDSNIICINNSFTITLPSDCEDGQEFVIMNTNQSKTITIVPASGDTGGCSLPMTKYSIDYTFNSLIPRFNCPQCYFDLCDKCVIHYVI